MKKLLSYGCFIIILLVGIIDIWHGTNYESRQDKFLKNAGKVVASIYETRNNEDGSQVLYINYYIKDKEYDNILVLEKNRNTNKSSIEIYYDKSNPININVSSIDNRGYVIIGIGIITIVLNISLTITFAIKQNKTIKNQG